MINLDALIHQARELKPLPASSVRLAALLSSQAADLEQIAEVVAYDQALTLQLIRAANAAFNAGATEISDAREAVFRLGTARTLSLSVAASVNSLMQPALSSYGLSEGGLWRHSVATATVAETLPEFCPAELPPETFTAALLHDVGKLVMARFLSPAILEMLHRAQTEGGCDPLQAETEILHVHHGELGGVVAQHWQMPERVVKGIIYHHEPEQGHDLICDAVYLSNCLAKSLETPAPPPVDASVLERLDFGAKALEQMRQEAYRRFDTVSARYNAA